MPPSWHLRRTVTVVRREKTGVDKYNDPVFGDVEIELSGCSWDERSTLGSESVEAQQQVVSGRNLFCVDPSADVRATDAVRFPDNGLTYEVDGEVGRVTGTRLGNDHMAVGLRLVSG